MGSNNGGRTRELPEKHAHTEVTGAHGADRSSLNGNNNNSSSNLNDDDIAYVEITADIVNDTLVHSVKTVRDADVEDTELSLLRSSVVGNAFKQVSQQLKRLTSLTPTPSRFDRTGSAATHNALNGLKFIKQVDGYGWIDVERKFDELTAETNGLLPRHLFGECIGMNKESQPKKSEKQKLKEKEKQQKQKQKEEKEKQRQKENEKQREKEKKEPEDFAGELFDALRRRRYISRDFINKAEMREFWDQLNDQKFDSRLQTFFDMVDKDADGRITKAELTEIIKLSASANKLSNIQKKQAVEYAALIMEEMDPDNFGYIRIEVLEKVLLKSLPQAASGEDQTLSQMLSKQLITTRGDGYPLWRRYQDFKYVLHYHWKRVWVLVLWIAVMASLFTWKYLQYKNKKDVYQVMGHCVCMAKGAAETLKLNMALILLPVCRNTITWFRNKTKLGKAVPFDDNLNFHFVVAIGIGLGVGIHGIYHLACDFPRLLHASEGNYKPMEKYFGEQPSNYWWFLKGWEGVTGIIMVVLMAIAFTLASPWLRSPKTSLPKPQKELTRFDAFCHSIHLFLKKLTGFNAFWYSHHLFVIVYACLIIHGIKLYLTKDWYKKTTWMYIAVPVILYGSERLVRALRSSIKPAKILDVAFYPGGVTALRMTKPQNFRYKSGQYMFVNCAAVSPFEWHPFSITSSPGDDYLSVHIRALGDWTGEIRTVFSKPHPDGKQERFRDDGLQGPNSNYPRVLIDGPYGAPAQEYKQYEVVLLVGLGIGATPMISIVKDIVNNMKAKEEEKNALENGLLTSPMATNSPSPMISTSKRKSGSSSTANDEFKTTKAYFYWVTKEQGSFDWFKGVMNEVAELDDKGVIEMHNYCTSVYEEGDPRSVFITMLQSINHAKNGVDVVSGTRVKSHFAKPNWQNVYNSIAQNHEHSRVGVFFCGAPMASIELKKLASEFTQKTSTKFDFHKEIF